MRGQVKILPVSDLRSNATNYLEQVKEQPFIITQRGRPRAVLVDYERYSQIAGGVEDAAVYTFRHLVSEIQASQVGILSGQWLTNWTKPPASDCTTGSGS
jgi:prevent-host-death family protein